MPDRETFRWREKLFDISALLADIAQGSIQAELIELNEEFVQNYCRLYLDGTVGETRPPIQVNIQYAEGLNQQRLEDPVILLYVGENEGLVSLREDEPEPHYVIADGNHRLLAARLRGCSLSAYILSGALVARYEHPIE